MPVCRLVMLFVGVLVLTGCPTENNDPAPKDMSQPLPTPERCEAIQTQSECFAAKCSFFATASELSDASDGCTVNTSFGQCVYSPNPEGNEVLTSYIKTINGRRVGIQLNVDVELPGWTRCGFVAVPPDCDCDGQ